MNEHSQPTAHVEIVDRYALIPEALLYDDTIPAEAVRVYGVLIRYGSDPSNCYPSHATIAGRIGKSARSVPTWIRALEDAGWVDRVPRFSPEGDPTSNGYRVHGRAVERGVRATERGGVRATERGGSALDNAPNESHVNESHVEGELTLVVADVVDVVNGFDAFWAAYPKRNGKRIGAGATLARWDRLTPGERAAAMIGAGHYGDACDRGLTLAKDPERWVRDKCWVDWQEPASDTSRRPSKVERNLDGLRRTAERVANPLDAIGPGR